MKISIIICAYQLEKYIAKCLDSIINQDLMDIEIIIVNNGSTDNTGEIISSFQQNNNMIKTIHLKENTPISDVKALAFEVAKGEYIIFSDGDDIFVPKCFSSLYDLAIKSDADIVLYDAMRVIDDNQVLYPGFDETPNVYRDLISYFFLTPTGIPLWCKFIKSTFLRTVDFPENIFAHEDRVMNISLSLKNPKIIYYRQVCYLWISHKSSITNKKNIRILDCINSINFVSEKLDKLGVLQKYKQELKVWVDYTIAYGILFQMEKNNPDFLKFMNYYNDWLSKYIEE